MAVVFISPKLRQKNFFLGITVVFLAFLAFVALSVFLSQPKQIPPELVFNKPKININTEIFASEQFKGLQLFFEMKMQFEYVAKTEDNKSVDGFVTAVSKEEAKDILEEAGLFVTELKQVEIGRENPFTPY